MVRTVTSEVESAAIQGETDVRLVPTCGALSHFPPPTVFQHLRSWLFQTSIVMMSNESNLQLSFYELVAAVPMPNGFILRDGTH